MRRLPPFSSLDLTSEPRPPVRLCLQEKKERKERKKERKKKDKKVKHDAQQREGSP